MTCESVTFTGIWDRVSSGLGLFSSCLFSLLCRWLSAVVISPSFPWVRQRHSVLSFKMKINRVRLGSGFSHTKTNREERSGGKQVLLAGFWLSLGDFY